MPGAGFNVRDYLGERVIRMEAARLRIGSDATNELILGGPEISPQHLEILLKDHGYSLRTVEEQFGTYLNDELVTGEFTQAEIRAALEHEYDLGNVVGIVNRELCVRSLPNQFVNVCVGVLNPPTGDFHYVNAGHCPPLHVAPGAMPRFLTATHAVLGVLPDQSYNTDCVHLDHGSAVVLYSDGLARCTSVDDVEFGAERLATFFATRATTAPEQIVKELLAHLEQFGLRGSPADDMTLLLIQRATGS